MLENTKSRVHATTASTSFTLVSQSLRIIGAGAGVAVYFMSPTSRFAPTALAVATIAPNLRLPFHFTRVVNKAFQASDSEHTRTQRAAFGMGALFLAARSLQIGLRFAPPLAGLATGVGIAMTLFKCGEVAFSTKDLLDRRKETGSIDRRDLLRLLNTTLLLGGGFALVQVTPSQYHKLVTSGTSLVIGLNITCSAALRSRSE